MLLINLGLVCRNSGHQDLNDHFVPPPKISSGCGHGQAVYKKRSSDVVSVRHRSFTGKMVCVHFLKLVRHTGHSQRKDRSCESFPVLSNAKAAPSCSQGSRSAGATQSPPVRRRPLIRLLLTVTLGWSACRVPISLPTLPVRNVSERWRGGEWDIRVTRDEKVALLASERG